MIAPRFYKLFRHIIFRIRTRGSSKLARTGPMILVSNHLGSFGPISVMTTLGPGIHPWVASQITEVDGAADRIRREFVERELHLRPPLSLWLSRLIARVCVALMRDIGAIPVYDHSRRIRYTLSRTLDVLMAGNNVLVFPENAAAPLNDVLCDFCTGFVHLARAYHLRTQRPISFLPVAVHRGAQTVRIGNPIPFDPTLPFAQEKQRVKHTLEQTIHRLYNELERERTA